MTRLSAQKILRYQQKPGWCGPAAIQMALAAGGIRKPQKDIARAVYKSWWGTTQQAIFAYLSKYFKRLNFRENSKLADVRYHLAKRHIVMVNWWDDFIPEDIDGHYTLLVGYSQKTKKVKLVDPLSERGIWKMPIKDFRDRWYDKLDVQNKTWIEGWMLWLDPKSRINT